MKRIVSLAMGIALVLATGTAAMAAPVGTTTINLRTWEGTTPIDDVRVCLVRGADLIVCGET